MAVAVDTRELSALGKCLIVRLREHATAGVRDATTGIVRWAGLKDQLRMPEKATCHWPGGERVRVPWNGADLLFTLVQPKGY